MGTAALLAATFGSCTVNEAVDCMKMVSRARKLNTTLAN